MASRESKKADVPTNVSWDRGLEPLVKHLSPGDQCWFFNSKFNPETVTLTAPTLAFAEEIKTRFGDNLERSLKKKITYQWVEDGAKESCKLGNYKRLNKLNPHIGYEPPSACGCYKCNGYRTL